MKKITCFTESLGGGGAEHQMVILAGMLADKGYDVTIVTYATIPDHYSVPNGVTHIDIGKTTVRSKTLKAVAKAMKIFKYFISVKTDCVISYRQCANMRVLIPLLFRKGIKAICSERSITTRMNGTEKVLFGFLYNRADYIVPNSKTQTDFISRYKPKFSNKLRTIHNYTDLQQFNISSVPEDLSTIRVGIFSRFSKVKNPVGFAKAMKELKAKTNHPFEVHWYGAQKDEINGYSVDYLDVKNSIEELHIEDVLKTHPPVKNPALLMENYHAMCLPSFFEGFSNSVAEGICSGKPMLVSDVSDNSVMVHNGENGFLFDPKQPDSICGAFLKFFDLTYDEMCQMAQKSRAIAEQLFDKEQFIQQYIDLIES